MEQGDAEVKIRDVLAIVNEMERLGVVERYAVGGAVGATFYLEPVATLDVDIFVAFKLEHGQLLITPQAIFDFLLPRGASLEGEYVVMGGWPVQFLPPTGPLAEEALVEAREFDVNGETARVITAEHLAALALETGRAKDKARLIQFVESGVLDAERFSGILARHGLTQKWQTFQRQVLE